MTAPPDLSVSIGSLRLKNPVILASGTCGYGTELSDFVDLNSLGGIVLKGISLKPRAGNPPPRVVETPSGLLNAIGLENVGVDAFMRDKLPALQGLDTCVIANILGGSMDEYGELARILDAAVGIHAIEVNVSCPNVKGGGVSFGTDPAAAAAVTEAVRKATRLPVITKLSPNVTDIAEVARAVEAAGADAVSLVNTILGMSIDIRRRRPALANVFGGLSGPAIRPVALRMVWQTVRAVRIPVIGMGGISSAADALEFLMAGASAVQLGTATLVNPRSCMEVISGIGRFMTEEGFSSITELAITRF